jgi:hypothetical protein
MSRVFKQKELTLKGDALGTWVSEQEGTVFVTKTFSTPYRVIHGTSSTPLAVTSAINLKQSYTRVTVTTGTARGIYERVYLAGGVGGEAVRAFATVENAAPTDTCNGIHASLNFGASAGNITGLGTAGRFTTHVNARSITGTVCAVQAELYGEASGDVGGTMSLIRAIVDGSDSTAKQNIETKAVFASIVCTARSGGMVPDSFAGNTTNMSAALKIKLNGNTWYIPLQSAVS